MWERMAAESCCQGSLGYSPNLGFGWVDDLFQVPFRVTCIFFSHKKHILYLGKVAQALFIRSYLSRRLGG